MARYNKIYAGPVSENLPQVQERLCAAAILPGTALVESGSSFAQAGAASNAKVYIAQDNYLAMKGVDDAWSANDRIIGMEILDEQFFNVRVPTGTNVTRGAGLTTNASGKFVLAATGNRIIAFAEEAYNNTSGADQLVRARVAKGNLASA
jgi:flagellar basal body rod protein FlgG